MEISKLSKSKIIDSDRLGVGNKQISKREHAVTPKLHL